MTDINDQLPRTASGMGGAAAVEALPPRESATLPDPQLIEVIELLFFAYRDFTGEADAILTEFGFGRAHHRVLHFVHRHPGLRVADLLDILKITKQSLGRVLKHLVDEGYIAQQAGKSDRRERLLFATARGHALAEQVSRAQRQRIARALDGAGIGAEDGVRAFLLRMVSEADRAAVAEVIAKGGNHAPGRRSDP